VFTNRHELLGDGDRSQREAALDILAAGIAAVDPYRSIKDFVSVKGNAMTVAGERYDLGRVEHVVVLGAGKAAIPMVTAVVDLLGDRAEGHVNALEDRRIGKVVVSRATHPIPGEEGVRGSKRIMALARVASERDLVLCLISGGGSALMPLPEEGLTLKDKMAMTDLLLKCGATIQELNCVRKHISAIKGGKLARAAAPAPLVSLILSDVIGDPLDSIASGPTAPDTTSYATAREILHRYGVWDRSPIGVRRELEAERFETPKAGDPIFAKVRNVLIGNNKKSQRAMVAKAKELGYRALEVEPYVLGDAREAAPRLLERSRALAGKARAAAVVAGGETTVVVRGKGRGGRNQEMALVDLGLLREGELFAAAGTDGIDGKSPAAGALADAAVAARAKELALDARAFLDDNDSTSFFERAGGLLVTGPTGTNVADVELYLVGAPKKPGGGK